MWTARLKISPRLTMPWHRDATMMHGIMSRLHGKDHTRHSANFILWHDDGDWHVMFRDREQPACLAVPSHAVVANRRPVDLIFVGVKQVHLPQIQPDAGRVLLTTKTPLVLTCDNHSKSCTDPSAEHIKGALQRMSDSLGLGLGVVDVEQAAAAGVGIRTVVGGHIQRGSSEVGVVIGWQGSMVLDCSPIALWLLRVAELVGIGGLVSMGFGRVQIARAHE